MPGAAEKYRAPWGKGLGLKIRIGFKVTHIGDKEFDLFPAQAAPQLFPVIHLQGGVDLGVGRDKTGYRQGHQVDRRHGVTAKTYLASVELGHARDFMAQQRRTLHQAQGVLQHHLAFGGRAQVLIGAVHQYAAELLLQTLDAAAEGRLGNAHGVGGAHETAVLVQRNEVAQLAEIHRGPASERRTRILRGALIPSTKRVCFI
ncbi:hypothetical protein AZH11_13805 [Pseudomonas simiae]|nr:hypothetical protein AZH11_13805 [Pseudomonas simiae]